jgi:selenocysteine lyase/cysteine desulfurase
MLNEAIVQILKWQPANIQSYCKKLSEPLVEFLERNGYWLEKEEYRSKHLFGILLPEKVNQDHLLQRLREQKIFVSVRGKAIRISLHLYNTEEDIEALIRVLQEFA